MWEFDNLTLAQCGKQLLGFCFGRYSRKVEQVVNVDDLVFRACKDAHLHAFCNEW